MTAKVLMIQGTSSSAGKSLLVAGLCHLYARRGLRVAPFKAQNMSNNAAICPDGSEIGRAQANQAFAAGLDPHVDMNPVLIKPEADSRAQVVVMGKAWQTLDARDYYPQKDELWTLVTNALDRLRDQYELVIIEGAGSAAELNLKDLDIVNMAVAKYAQAPVLLVGDIDRGGIFAQLIGTTLLLDDEERQLLKGLVINKFRGDSALFYDGIQILEEKSGKPVIGVLPWLYDLLIPEEDAVILENGGGGNGLGQPDVDIAVIHFPRIANFDEFDALKAESGVSLRFVDDPQHLGNPDAIILPGTKSTIGDLEWLRSRGFEPSLQQHVARDKALVGICGGYQMLGQRILDPQNIESSKDEEQGLAFLPTETSFEGEKATHQSSGKVGAGPGWLQALEGQHFSGYEIHMGRTQTPNPWLTITQRNAATASHQDGAASPDGKIWGCYIHSIFDNHAFRRAWLQSLAWSANDSPSEINSFRASLTRLADELENNLDMDALEQIIWAV